MLKKTTRQNTNINKDLGRRLRMARLAAHLTSQELGDQTGHQDRTIANMETGHIEISADALYAFSQVLGQPISWFFQDAIPISTDNNPDLYFECLNLLEHLNGSYALSGVRDVLKLAVESE